MDRHRNGEISWDALARLCLAYAEARAELEHASEAIRAEQRAAARKGLREITRCSAALTRASEDLRSGVGQALRLGMFSKPRTRVLEGVRIGVKKQPGRVEVSDEAHCISLIRKHLTDKAEQLIRTRESLDKAVLRSLDAQELELIGARTVPGEDEIIAGTDGDVDALLAALLADAKEADPKPEEETQ